VIPIKSFRLRKNSPVANCDGGNEVKPGKAAQNESLECKNKSDPRHWIPGWFQDDGEYQARRRWNQTSSKPCMDHCVEYGAFSKSPMGISLGALSAPHQLLQVSATAHETLHQIDNFNCWMSFACLYEHATHANVVRVIQPWQYI